MGRQRMEIAFIANDSRRRVTCSKRKSELLKLASQLVLLCDAHVAVVVFSAATGKVFALGAPSVDHVLRRFAPPLLSGDRSPALADRAAAEGVAQRTAETVARVAAEKARKKTIGDRVLQAVPRPGGDWWEADVEALGEEELREFARALWRFRKIVCLIEKRREDTGPTTVEPAPQVASLDLA